MSMIFTTTETIPGKEIREVLGVVSGNVVQSKHIGRDIMAGLKSIVGGEIRGYTEMLNDLEMSPFQEWSRVPMIKGQMRLLE